MLLKIKDVGILQKADIELSGLSVVAGLNDTGKSTVGKVLFSLIKADMISLLKFKRHQAKNLSENRKKNFDTQIGLVFKGQIADKGEILFETETYEQKIVIKQHKTEKFTFQNLDKNSAVEEDSEVRRVYKDAAFIQTPFVWDLSETFRGISNFHAESELLGLSTRIPFPYLLWDLYVKLSSKLSEESEQLFSSELNDIEKTIDGKFEWDERGDIKFVRGSKTFEIVNVAVGIKLFGILQMLLANRQIEQRRILIIDEPEMHLHPQWQIVMAKLMVSLAKNGIGILTNTHSPYILEGIKIYSEVMGIEKRTKFHLADNGMICPQESLEAIFEKIAIPMHELKRLKWENV